MLFFEAMSFEGGAALHAGEAASFMHAPDVVGHTVVLVDGAALRSFVAEEAAVDGEALAGVAVHRAPCAGARAVPREDAERDAGRCCLCSGQHTSRRLRQIRGPPITAGERQQWILKYMHVSMPGCGQQASVYMSTYMPGSAGQHWHLSQRMCALITSDRKVNSSEGSFSPCARFW